jgi:hypothetical protein
VVTLSTINSLDSSNTLEVAAFHRFNNYITNYYNQTQLIKNNIENRYQNLSSHLSLVIFAFGTTNVVLIVACFLFILSRLFKVTNGFS